MSSAPKFTAAAAAVHRQISEIREQISGIVDEIQWLENAPPPHAEVEARAHLAVDREAATFVDEAKLGDLIHRGEVAELLNLFGRAEIVSPGATIAGARIGLAPALCWLFGDSIKAKLTKALQGGELDFEAGPPTVERPRLIGAARDRLRALEIEEENIILEAEQAGVEIARRADVDPALILNAHEIHVYKFKAEPILGEIYFGEIESDERLTLKEILAQARRAIPDTWLAEHQLEAVVCLERQDSEDILPCIGLAEDMQPRTQQRKPSRKRSHISPGFGPDSEKEAIKRDLDTAS